MTKLKIFLIVIAVAATMVVGGVIGNRVAAIYRHWVFDHTEFHEMHKILLRQVNQERQRQAAPPKQ